MTIKARSIILTAILCFNLISLCGFSVFSEDSGSVALTVVDFETKTPLKDSVFRIYKFASAYESEGKYSFVCDEAFKANGMSTEDLSDEYLPIHLSVYAEEKDLPYKEAVTDSDGRIVFEDLALGAYLLVPVSVSEGYLIPNPFIVTLPMWDAGSESWQFDIAAAPKLEADTQTEEKTYISVKKEWHGFGGHPDKVNVVLLKDGEIAERLTLCEENNWYFKWEELDKNHSWNVVETDAPSGFRVEYEASQMTVVIKNISEKNDDSDSTDKTDTTPSTDTKKPDQLIQTGQLKWPVPILAVAGLLLFSLGWALLNIGRKDGDSK